MNQLNLGSTTKSEYQKQRIGNEPTPTSDINSVVLSSSPEMREKQQSQPAAIQNVLENMGPSQFFDNFIAKPSDMMSGAVINLLRAVGSNDLADNLENIRTTNKEMFDKLAKFSANTFKFIIDAAYNGVDPTKLNNFLKESGELFNSVKGDALITLTETLKGTVNLVAGVVGLEAVGKVATALIDDLGKFDLTKPQNLIKIAKNFAKSIDENKTQIILQCAVLALSGPVGGILAGSLNRLSGTLAAKMAPNILKAIKSEVMPQFVNKFGSLSDDVAKSVVNKLDKNLDDTLAALANKNLSQDQADKIITNFTESVYVKSKEEFTKSLKESPEFRKVLEKITEATKKQILDLNKYRPELVAHLENKTFGFADKLADEITEKIVEDLAKQTLDTARASITKELTKKIKEKGISGVSQELKDQLVTESAKQFAKGAKDAYKDLVSVAVKQGIKEALEEIKAEEDGREVRYTSNKNKMPDTSSPHDDNDLAANNIVKLNIGDETKRKKLPREEFRAKRVRADEDELNKKKSEIV
jgi:hypothetical protein